MDRYRKWYCTQDARASFVLHSVDADTATVDTLLRVDVTLVGETAQTPDALAYAVKGQVRNYYFPHCPNNGVEGVRGFNRLIYQNVYPFIDWHFLSAGTAGQTMLLVVRPGGDPDDITMRFQGQDDLDVDVNGLLRVWLGGRCIELNEAVAYQVDDEGNIIPLSWNAEYNDSQGNGKVKFYFDSYDPALPLVFRIGAPPFGGPYEENGLCYSTYLGGPGEEYVLDSDESAQGWLYMAGTTSSDILDFPPVPGNDFYDGGAAAYVVGFNAIDELKWKTFVGGDLANETYCAGIAVRNPGPAGLPGVLFAGSTFETALQVNQPGNSFYRDVTYMAPNETSYIGRLNLSTGNREWLTYFEPQAGWAQGINIQGIDVAPNGRLLISGITSDGLPPIDEPATPSQFSAADPPGIGLDGFVAMFTESDRLWWRSYVPCSDPTYGVEAVSVACNASKIVLACWSADGQIPLHPVVGAYNQTYIGGTGQTDIFLWEYDIDGVTQWSTYFGGPYDEFLPHDDGALPGWNNVVRSVIIEPGSGDVVIFGTVMNDLPIVPGTGWYDDTPDGNLRSFVVRFDGTTRDILWSTYVDPGPGGTSLLLFGVCFDPAGNLWAGGVVDAPNIPIVVLPGYWDPPGVVQNTTAGVPSSMSDAVLMCWDPQQDFRYAHFFGGASEGYRSDRIITLRHRNANGNLYFAGHTSKDIAGGPGFLSTYFPLDEAGGPPTYFEDTYMGGPREAFVASLCSELFTGLSGPTPINGTLTAAYLGSGNYAILGLKDGTEQYNIVDLSGAFVRHGVLQSKAGRAVCGISGVATGVYVLSTAGRAVKLWVP